MGTYTQILYQIVFSTKFRERTLIKEHRKALFEDIWGILKNKKCHLYRLNGVEDHIHIITDLHPTVALSSLVKDIKLGSTSFIKKTGLFPQFGGWQEGFSAFTYHISAKDNLIEYVKNQETHHATKTFREELEDLFKEHGINYEEKYLD
jgi:putative transposase